MVKDVIDAHGDGITVESELGGGTVFHITLPVEGPPTHSRSSLTLDDKLVRGLDFHFP